jgi:predicted nuclease with TOPRIM domain
MQDSAGILNNFSTRVRQLILRLDELKKENTELKELAEQHQNEINELKDQLNLKQNQYNAMMMAKMIEITDGDIEASRKRVQKLIRSVNKCISLVNGDEDEGID